MYNQNNYGPYMGMPDYRHEQEEMYNMPDMNTYNNQGYYMQNPNMPNMPMDMNMDLESLYPETYRLIHPMVIKACEENKKPITKETIDDMAKKICAHFEVEGTVEINVKQEMKNGDVINPRSKQYMQNTPKEIRRSHNNYLEDLVKILLITNFIKRPIVPPMPIPPHYIKPPYYRDGEMW